MMGANDVAERQEVLEAGNGLALHATVHEARQAKGVVLLHHGYAEHSGRYAHVQRFLARQGYTVYSYDARGHGKSPGEKALIRDFDDLLDDVDLMVARIRDRHGETPFFLLGHSLGGAVTTLWAITRKPVLNGLVVSSPLFRVRDDGSPAWLKRVAPLVAKVAPSLATVPGPAPRDLANDPSVGERFAADPLCYQGKVKAATGAAILDAVAAIARGQEDLACPVLILQGADDRVVDPAGAAAVADAALSFDKTYRLLPGLGHEIFNEKEGQDVLDEVVRWLDRHLVLATLDEERESAP